MSYDELSLPLPVQATVTPMLPLKPVGSQLTGSGRTFGLLNRNSPK